MKIISQGKGELVGWHDPDEARDWVLHNKARELKDKTTTVVQAVTDYVRDGDYIASGGFGAIRVSMSVVFEIIRHKRRNLIMAGKTAVHDLDLLVTSGCVDRVEVAYSFAHEMRGLSPGSRRMVETGKCRVISEVSNAVYQWRFLAGMMGVPFIPCRSLLGTDTLEYSSCRVVEDPFSGKPVTLVPAAYPDVAFIHVHRCDKYGNAQIDGIAIEDIELARCARRLIITTEELVDNDVIRDEPWKTTIPYLVVDAVVKVPYGSHPGQMPYLYYFDEEHIAEWLEASRSQEGADRYLDKYVFSVSSFDDYLELCGGLNKIEYIKRREKFLEPMISPWRKK